MARYNRATDPGALKAVIEQLEARIAIIRVNDKEMGTGFLVAEKILLTAQHVVETPAGELAEPDSIKVTFDFGYQPHATRAEIGHKVAVAEILFNSPPTNEERSDSGGADWDASPQYLDYALLQLERRALILSHGKLKPRDYYMIDFNLPKVASSQVLYLGHHPYGELIKTSHLTSPKVNDNGTRIEYQGDTGQGSSGGAIVDTEGKLIALHHYASKTGKHGVPVSAIAQDIKGRGCDFLFEQTPPEDNLAHLGLYSANARRQICQAMGTDWRKLTKRVPAPASVESAEDLWDWLASHKKLGKLYDVLKATGHTDLVQILDEDVIIVDEAAIENIQDLAELLIESAEYAQLPGHYLPSALKARSLARILLGEIKSLRSIVDDDRAQLRWRMTWRSELAHAANELKRLLRLLPAPGTDASFSRRRLPAMTRVAYDVQSTIEKLGELAQSPELLAV